MTFTYRALVGAKPNEAGAGVVGCAYPVGDATVVQFVPSVETAIVKFCGKYSPV